MPEPARRPPCANAVASAGDAVHLRELPQHTSYHLNTIYIAAEAGLIHLVACETCNRPAVLTECITPFTTNTPCAHRANNKEKS